MTAAMDAPRKAEWFATRRSLVLGAIGAMGLGAGGAVVEHVWKKKDMTARLFNPFSLAHFDLPPVPELLDAAGKPVPGLSSADLAGKRCLLNVWASWCPTCREEHKYLVALARRNLAPIYGVDVKDPPARARYFLAKHGNPFDAIGADTETYLQRALGVHGVPATFVIGPGHVIEWSTNEGLTEAVIEKEIAPRLAIKVSRGAECNKSLPGASLVDETPRRPRPSRRRLRRLLRMRPKCSTRKKPLMPRGCPAGAAKRWGVNVFLLVKK